MLKSIVLFVLVFPSVVQLMTNDKLMAVCAGEAFLEFLRLAHLWLGAEEWVLQCLFYCQPFVRVKNKKLIYQIIKILGELILSFGF
jgi:hypothetical protein